MSTTQVVLQNVRVSYPHLFAPHQADGMSAAKYMATFLIPKTDGASVNAINAAIAVATQQGMDGSWKGFAPQPLPITLYDGDGVQKSGLPWSDECKGHYVLRTGSSQAPGVIDMTGSPITDPAKIYAGCYVHASLNFFPYNSNGNKGVSAGLNNVLFVKNGEPLGGRTSAANDFANLLNANAAAQTAAFAQQAAPAFAQQGTPAFADMGDGITTF